MFLKNLVFIGTLLLPLFSMTAQAGDQLRICETCNSYSDYSNAALQGITGPTSDIVSVLNPKTGNMLNFTVVVEIEPGAPVIKYVEAATITSSEYQMAAQATSGYASLLSFFDTTKEIPPALADSVFDVIGNSQKQNALSDYYNASITSGQTWSLYWAAIGSLGGTLSQISFTVDIIFPDGSRAVMRLSGINSPSSSRLFYLALMESYDTVGNRVPQTNGEFDYRRNDMFYAPTAESMYQLLELADRYNTPYLLFTPESYRGGGRVYFTDCNTVEDCVKPD